jgi:hypothetical protein
VGHIVLGVGMLRDAVRDQPGLPVELVTELEHLILSHHGSFEHGSPVEPKTVEAYCSRPWTIWTPRSTRCAGISLKMIRPGALPP